MSRSERIDALVAGDPPEADEQRLARLIYELQAARPVAPEALRQRVQTIAATESSSRPTLLDRVSLKRALFVLAPAVLIVSVGAAAVHGIVTATSDVDQVRPVAGQEARGVEGAPLGAGAAPPWKATRDAGRLEATKAHPFSQVPSANLPTPRGRTKDYHAALRLRVDDVDDLSAKTQQALSLTRRYGGYVVSTNFRNPRPDAGDASLELRVPIGRVQEALVAFSELGTIMSQDVSIRDLQGQIDRYTRDIRRLRDRMAALRASLLDPNLSAAERARIESELAQARSRVGTLEQERRVLLRQGRFAKISLGLTTERRAVQEEGPGRIERAVDDAGSVLAKELAFGLYVLIVASPFLLLAALAIVGARAGRRRADQRLLERA